MPDGTEAQAFTDGLFDDIAKPEKKATAGKTKRRYVITLFMDKDHDVAMWAALQAVAMQQGFKPAEVAKVMLASVLQVGEQIDEDTLRAVKAELSGEDNGDGNGDGDEDPDGDE